MPSEGVNVRASATTSSKIVTTCACNAKVTVNGRSGDWYKVTANGVNGFIRGDLLKTAGVVKASGGLNVRAGPSTGHSRVSGLSDGASVTITNIQNGWYQISSGWVCGDYIVLSGSPSTGGGGGGGGKPISGTIIRQGDSRFNSNIRRWGCAFMSCCWCGGVNSIDGCNALYNKAVNNGYMRSDCYILNWATMATGIGNAKSYKWAGKNEYPPSNAKEILQCANAKTSSHFIVGNGHGAVEYDPAAQGWTAYSDCQSKRFFYY